MKEALLYKTLKNKKVQCQNCYHYCLIEPGQRGFCGIKENIDGKLYALNYEKVIAFHIDPIEKKPLFHFLPGTYSLSLATVGCNFTCLNCQNWEISQGFKDKKEIPGERIPAKKIVALALENRLPSISYTYTEPTIFSEYALEIMKLAKEKGIKNVWVSNGFWSPELFKLIFPYLDAVNVDLKYFSDQDYQKYSGAKLKPILENLKRLKEKNIWVEITTLVIPTISDSEKTLKGIASFIKKELGKDTPWHVTRFSGIISWKLQHLPDTPIETIKKAYKIGKEVGLNYVYTGNIPGLDSENTFCPQCQSLCIKRMGYTIFRYDKNGKCPQCNYQLKGVF